jgi:hypothetical protein
LELIETLARKCLLDIWSRHEWYAANVKKAFSKGAAVAKWSWPTTPVGTDVVEAEGKVISTAVSFLRQEADVVQGILGGSSVARLLPEVCQKAGKKSADDSKLTAVKAFMDLAEAAVQVAEEMGSKEMSAWLRSVRDESSSWARELWKGRVLEVAARVEQAEKCAKVQALDSYGLDEQETETLMKIVHSEAAKALRTAWGQVKNDLGVARTLAERMGIQDVVGEPESHQIMDKMASEADAIKGVLSSCLAARALRRRAHRSPRMVCQRPAGFF